MKIKHPIRYFLDNTFKGFYLEKYILKDGKQHPVAIICPGGGYHRVCSFIEGLPYAKKLNEMGYSAIVVHYRVTMGEKAHEGSRNYLLGDDQSAERIEFASIEKQLTKDYPPTFLWCGLEDSCVVPTNSFMLAKALEEKEVEHEFLPIEGVEHGVGIGKGLPCEGWFEKAVKFWEEHR